MKQRTLGLVLAVVGGLVSYGGASYVAAALVYQTNGGSVGIEAYLVYMAVLIIGILMLLPGILILRGGTRTR
jgi:TRAP-type C4-dicarboxylate transport system permease small subunit